MRQSALPVLLACLVTGACSETDDVHVERADRVLLNAEVYTVDAKRSWAQAIAIRDGTIVFVGSDADAKNWIAEETEVSDLGGQMLLPGFHDSHVHILTGVMAEDECSLLRLESVEAIERRLEECTRLEGLGDERWIIGGGWGEWLFPNANPHKDLLDKWFPDRPVYLDSSYGHGTWVNSRALELAGIDGSTPNPPAGIIERDPDTGDPSGTLRESAMALVTDIAPEMTLEQRIKRVRAAIRYANAHGITAVIEPGMDGRLLEPVIQLADSGELSLRSLISISPINWQAGVFGDEVYEFIEQRDQWRRENLSVDSVKIYLDGVPEYGTSPLLEPYEKAEFGSGDFFYTDEQIEAFFTRFDAMGLQIHVHACGDAAVRQALDGFEAARRANGESDNRHHITHLQLIHEDDRSRFAELGVTATFQALWAYPDEAALELDIPLLGRERTWQMYPVGGVHKYGGRVAGASDFYVTEINPLLAIEVAVTRQDPHTNAGPVLNEHERVDLATMIEAYTINGAWLHKKEDVQGSIEVGKRADLVVLDRNLFEIPASEISDVSVTMTVFDGRTVYQR